ncbi:hypothetical protein HZS_3602 [Henneguya salminicola]|nr:hypothetical protein HZS_3602 [Henneguya salminicola]
MNIKAEDGPEKRKKDSLSSHPLVKFTSIAFIQEDNITTVYKALEEHICINGSKKQFRELLNYYEDTFIIRYYCTCCSESSFSIR